MQIQARAGVHIQWQDDSCFHIQGQDTCDDDEEEDDVQVVVEVDDTFRHNFLNSMDRRMEQELVGSMACTRVDERE